MSSLLARNLLREFTNWTPRSGTKKCHKCKHEYSRHTMFPLFTNNIFLDDNNNDDNRYTYCHVGGCKCKGFIDDE
jgi:hypothetical protein